MLFLLRVKAMSKTQDYKNDFAVITMSRCLVGKYNFRQVYSKPISIEKAADIISGYIDSDSLWQASDKSIAGLLVFLHMETATHKHHVSIAYRSFQDSMVDFCIDKLIKD
jgi:hypothetical protein